MEIEIHIEIIEMQQERESNYGGKVTHSAVPEGPQDIHVHAPTLQSQGIEVKNAHLLRFWGLSLLCIQH